MHIRSFPVRWSASLLASLLLCACASDELDGSPPPDLAHDRDHGAALPVGLAVPPGHELAFTLHARGDQVYACRLGEDGSFGWTFVAPEARLFERSGRRAGEHFAGPTWEATDDSTVVATKQSEATVDADAIPWLLLRASATTGRGRMANVTYVQRIDTVGGRAPTAGCDAQHVDARSAVRYEANYTFYRAAP